MLDRLSRRATVLLLGAVFSLTFTVQLLLSDGSSAPQRKAARDLRPADASAPAAAPKVRLVAAGTVPALREPRRPRQSRKPRREATPLVPNAVDAAPTVEPEPVTPAATVQPAPTAAPRYIPPRPQPKSAAPAPTAAPPPGDFDTTGES